MINCIIIDDEPHAINALAVLIRQTPFLNLVHTSTSPLKAIQFINTEKVPLVFLDMHMPEMHGLDVVKAISHKTSFILCTAFGQYALESFEYNVLDYLLKPVSLPRFLRAAQKAYDRIEGLPNQNTSAEYFFIKAESRNSFVKIKFADILYIDSVKNYVNIYTATEKWLTRFLLKELMEELPPDSFIRVHNSYIVPLHKITYIDGEGIKLSDVNKKIPVGETYRAALQKALRLNK
jgi:two-component system, LytTR family, response regulator